MTEVSESFFTCLDPDVPLALTTLAADKAVEVRRDNDGTNLHAAGDRLRFWATGTTLHVRFLDSPDLADRVMTAAAAWSQHANLTFRLVTGGPADIRVTFEGDGNWSALGTDALVPELYPPDEPTMCLAELPVATSSTRVDRLARHEFGHAIGLIHEHSSPAAGMRWNKPAVYAALTTAPNRWTRAMVDHNVFKVYDTTTTNYSTFDPNSIMLYTFPPDWTLDGRTYPENHMLSPVDEAFIATVYSGRV